MGSAAEIGWGETRTAAASMEATAVVDGERHVAVNEPYAELHGYSDPDDLVGEPWADRLAEDERDRLEREILPACREDGQWRGTAVGRRRDGTTFSQELSVAHLDDEHFVCAGRELDGDEPLDGAASPREFVAHVFDALEDIVYVLDEAGDPVL